MAKYNNNFQNLKKNYLFIEISKRISEFITKNPDVSLIRMGIGDVTLPLVPAVVEAGKKAFDEMGVKSTFRGYEDSGRGYDFLREAVGGYYKDFGVELLTDEIFISDGAKSDSGNIGDIFASDCDVIVTDPAYPVYVDSSIMGGRKVTFADFNTPIAPKDSIIYLCSPNNPTGEAYSHNELKAWVDVALANNAVIVYDAAYEAFISETDKARSIFQIKGARKCAVEICSLSKTAGFTGTRCGYTIVPNELMLTSSDGSEIPLIQLWSRRQGSKFNGVSYPVQRAAEAVFSKEGQQQIKESIGYYRKNAKIIMDTFIELGISFTGGVNSPYVWFDCPNNMDSWDFFDFMLTKANVVGTPGVGFGENGANKFRLTAFNTYENTVEAMARLKKVLLNKS
ncbi:MAG: LL-diaminopimelate aminotransferase [Oscillospiraceae bacterium]|nr:LL-diaminopimelate aminotransferase [Oscillospiraceae bacterium]